MRHRVLSAVLVASLALVGCASPEADESEDQGSAAATNIPRTVAASPGSRFADVVDWTQAHAGNAVFNLVTVAGPDDGAGNDRHLVVTNGMGPAVKDGPHTTLAWYVPLAMQRVSVRERDVQSSWDLIPLSIERNARPAAPVKLAVDARYDLEGRSIWEGGVKDNLALSGGFQANLAKTKDAQLVALDGIWGLTPPLALGDMTVRLLTVDNLGDPLPPEPFAPNLGKTVIAVRTSKASVAFDLHDRHGSVMNETVKPAGESAITFTTTVADVGPKGTLPGMANHTETFRAEIAKDLRSVKVTMTSRTRTVVSKGEPGF